MQTHGFKLSASLVLVLAVLCQSAFAQIDRADLEEFIAAKTDEAQSRKADALKRAAAKKLPPTKHFADGTRIELQYFDNGRPIYYVTDNLNAARTVSTDKLWPTGNLDLFLDGTGETLGIWDGGSVRDSHQEFTGRVTKVDAANLSDHSTHVAGTMIAAGVDPAAQGMAFAAHLRSRDWNNDTGEMAADQLLNPPIAVSNPN